MVVPIDFNNIRIGDKVLVKSRKEKFFALGVIIKISRPTESVLVKITSFDTKGTGVRPWTSKQSTYNNKYLKIEGETWFTKLEIFRIKKNND